MTHTSDCRIIHTKLYSKIALEVLQSVEGQLSDGMWENSPAMEKYWKFSNVTTAPDGEVLIEISKDRFDNRFVHNGFVDMTDTEVIKWFAAKVKHIMQTEMKDNDDQSGWKRDNTEFTTDYLSYDEEITVSDVYFIYDFLLGRDTTRKYSTEECLKIKGEPKPEAEVKAEKMKRAARAKLEAEWSSERKALEEGHTRRIAEINAEFQTAVKELDAKMQAKLNELLKA